MSDKSFFNIKLLSGNASKFEKALWILEMIVTYLCIVLTVTFVFTGIMVKHDSHWWIGITICLILWIYSLWNRGRFSIEDTSENEGNIKTLFLCILFSGFVIRFVLALTLLPILRSDCAVLIHRINEWSSGNFIETKSMMQTAFFAFLQWLIGPSLQSTQIINALLGTLQIALTFDLAKRIFKRSWIAIVAAAITAFHPTFITLTLGIYTELLFGIFMLLSFRAFAIVSERIENKLYDKWTIIESGKLSLYCLGLFYTRGNGLFLIFLCLAMLLFIIKFNKQGFVKVILPYFLITVLIFVFIGLLNIKIIGNFVISSSEDSYWPLLFGSCTATKGAWSQADTDLINAKYYEIYPGKKGHKIPTHEVVPLIKDEFKRRWRENTQQMIDLAISKYKNMWSGGDYWVSWFLAKSDEDFAVRKWDLLKKPTRRIKQIGAVCLACWLILLPGMSSTSRRTVLLMLMFIFMNIINHFFVEMSIRYSYPLTVTLSVLAPGILLFWPNGKNDTTNLNTEA